MRPSSRTPEGEPARCAVCGNLARVEPSSFPVADAPCPHCGHLLFFAASQAPGTGETILRQRVLVREATAVLDSAIFDTGDRITWATISVASAAVIWLHDASACAALLWLWGILAFSQLALPAMYRLAYSALDENCLLSAVVFGWAFVGMPVGVSLGVLIPWVQDWGLSSVAGGLIGLVIGPVLAAVEGVVIAAAVDLLVWLITGRRLLKGNAQHG